jgi:hypothetical protein
MSDKNKKLSDRMGYLGILSGTPTRYSSEHQKIIVGILCVVSVVLFVLKLTHSITWPWLWVTATIWIPILAILFGLMICAFLVTIIYLFAKFDK